MEYTTTLEKSATLLATNQNQEEPENGETKENGENKQIKENGEKTNENSTTENTDPSQQENNGEQNTENGENTSKNKETVDEKVLPEKEELTNIELKSPENTLIHFRDVSALGGLLTELFKNKIDKKHPFYELLQDLIEKLKNKTLVEKLTVDKVLEHGFFRENIVISVVEFLKYLSAKGKDQKEEFFKGLNDSVSLMSLRDTIDIVLPHILCVDTLREPSVHHFLSHLFVPKDKEHPTGVFEKELFESLVMSWICRSFTDLNIVIRIALLKQISNYLKFIKQDELENTIWPLIWNSSSEQNDELIIATIHAFIHLLTFWKAQKLETLHQKIQLIVPYVARLAEVDSSLKVRVSAIRILPKIWQSCPADVKKPFFFITKFHF